MPLDTSVTAFTGAALVLAALFLLALSYYLFNRPAPSSGRKARWGPFVLPSAGKSQALTGLWVAGLLVLLLYAFWVFARK